MNQFNKNNETIAKNENLDPPEYSDHLDGCDCPNCEDEKEYCLCGNLLKENEEFCSECV